MIKDHILASLQRYGSALSTGDFSAIANGWAVPAIVLSDSGALMVTSMQEIERFFGKAVEWYKERGITTTYPELLRSDVLSERLVAVDVHWPSLDANGNEVMSELSHYILELGSDGQFRIRVALSRTSDIKGDLAL